MYKAYGGSRDLPMPTSMICGLVCDPNGVKNCLKLLVPYIRRHYKTSPHFFPAFLSLVLKP